VKQKLKMGALLLSLGVGTAFADLISMGAIPLTGQGLGHVNTVLTVQSSGSETIESGCVGAGVGGTLVIGIAKCPGAGPNGGNPFTGGNEQTGAGQDGVFQASALGLTNFINLRIIFNPSEPGGGGANSITLDNLALTLWSPTTGLILDARYVAGPPVFFPTSDPGTGNAGFGFALDGSQAGILNGILAANPDLYIGLSANVSSAQGGPETFSIGTVVPEPAAFVPIALVMAVFTLRKRLQIPIGS